jgi:TonB family protein
MTFRTAATRVGLCAALALAVPAVAPAQTAPTEQELLARMSRQPSEVVNYLDLARLYAGAQRYAEAEDMLARATSLVRGIREARSKVVPTLPHGATEQELQARIKASPNSVGNYLEMAKFYADIQQYESASSMLARATELVRNARLGPNALTGTQPLRVGGAISEPKKIVDAKPVYPAEALAQNISGVVILEVVIDQNGNVREAKVLRPVAMLDQAALDAVRKWRFTPTLLNGTPVEVMMTVTVSFTTGG